MKTYLIGLLFLTSLVSFSQEKINGQVFELNSENQEIPLLGANVRWLKTTIGTTTDEKGNFTIPYAVQNHMLVISYVGYQTDTIHVHEPRFIKHTLKSNENLDEVVITKERKSLQKSFLQTANVTQISAKELLKAACCNLSESFETNPSIDVNYSDAVTGNKQIKMLGLTSPYILITEENIPAIRGASQSYGLSFIPGTWIESLQVTKGAGSVVNGYESISGQINAEYIKPFTADPLFVNAYASSDSRFELNTHVTQKVSEKWKTTLFVHGNTRTQKNDMNHDGFLDNPLAKQVNFYNRWQYVDPTKGWVSFINLKYMNDQKQAGQMNYNPDEHRYKSIFWGSEINSQRVELSSKLGYVNPDKPYQSVGVQSSYTYHKQNSYFGNTVYDIGQKSVYATAIYNSILGNTMHKFSTGLNTMFDLYDEKFNMAVLDRKDNSVGSFFEYTYDNLSNFSMILGGRLDYHNRMGVFVTPRLHVRYVPWEKGVVRLSAGRGKRIANILAENQSLMASSRNFIIQKNGTGAYGLQPEIAWNYGISYNHQFKILGKDADVNFDFYSTQFQQQAVVDVFENTHAVVFHNLKGSSYANSFQLDFNIEPFKHFTVRTSYKYFDLKTDYSTGSYERPLQAKHRFFTNLAYQTPIKENGKHWRFDYTFNWTGAQRLPYNQDFLTTHQMDIYSPDFVMMNTQITHSFGKKMEVYVGGENITNYKQKHAILGNQNSFTQHFDASMIYASVFGAMYYVGLRINI